MRRAAKKDDNHKAIVAELEKRGFVVFDTSSCAGLGFDIVVYKPTQRLIGHGEYLLFEIKQPGHDRFDTDSEKKARARAPIPVIHSVEEALRYF